MNRRGKLITLEGGDGSGKSSLAGLLHELLEQSGYRSLLTCEPGGTDLGQSIWRLFDVENGIPVDDTLSPLAELFLFAADRAQHVDEVIRPALEQGIIVLCSRFTDSTLAYQGYGRGLNLDHLRAINHIATGGLAPDLTLLLDVPVETGLRRKRGEQVSDRIGQEDLEFHERVRQGFLELARKEPGRFQVIDASQGLEVVTQLSWRHLRQLLDRLG